VEIRWVARSTGSSKLIVDVGATVVFRKQTFLKSKISSATIEETRPAHQNLFRAVQSALSSGEDETQPGESPNTVPAVASPEVLAKGSSWFFGWNIETGVLGLLLFFLFIVYRSEGLDKGSYQCSLQLNDLNQEFVLLRTELLELKASLKEVKDLLRLQVSTKTRED
jgi:hypothetical protein